MPPCRTPRAWPIALALAACSPPPPHPDIFLISLDTTRADAISAWGMAPAGRDDLRGTTVTPNLDAMAAGGVRYAWAFAHAPTTLLSHSTVFTGLDPHELTIVRNGYPLGPSYETLAERLKADGFQTMAVLGSSSLARPMGVDRGFELGSKMRYMDDWNASLIFIEKDGPPFHLDGKDAGKPVK